MQFHVRAQIQIVKFEEHVHVRWNTWHGKDEIVLGVCIFPPAEWEAFQELCAMANIEITYEQPRAALSA